MDDHNKRDDDPRVVPIDDASDEHDSSRENPVDARDELNDATAELRAINAHSANRRTRLLALRDAFMVAHEAGMAGLASKDYRALEDAIAREQQILAEQDRLLNEASAEILTHLKASRSRFNQR